MKLPIVRNARNYLFGILSLVLGTSLLLFGCDNPSKQATLWDMNQACDLHSTACTSTRVNEEDNGVEQKATLSMMPRPVPVARAIAVSADLENIEAQSVELDISGLSMYMGYNRVDLTTMDGKHWAGTSMLAFCTDDMMEWQITLMITQKDGKKIQIPYYLMVKS